MSTFYLCSPFMSFPEVSVCASPMECVPVLPAMYSCEKSIFLRWEMDTKLLARPPDKGGAFPALQYPRAESGSFYLSLHQISTSTHLRAGAQSLNPDVSPNNSLSPAPPPIHLPESPNFQAGFAQPHFSSRAVAPAATGAPGDVLEAKLSQEALPCPGCRFSILVHSHRHTPPAFSAAAGLSRATLF